MTVLDVQEWWEIPTIGDEWEIDLTVPGCRFVDEWSEVQKVTSNTPVDMRPNTDLDDFFARPSPPPVHVVEGNMRKNDLLDAIFGV